MASSFAAPPHRADPAERRRLRILLAEDDRALRTMLQEALERDGWDVHPVANGAELASELSPWLSFGAKPPADLLISDLWMPGLTGLEVLEGLTDAGFPMPAILMSAFCTPEARDIARRLGALAVFDKPFDVDDLRTVVLNATFPPSAAP